MISTTRPTHFLDIFYNILFHPVTEFRLIAREPRPKNRWLFYGLSMVLLVSALAPIIDFMGHGGNPAELAIQIPVHIIAGLVFWLVMGLIVSSLAYTFTGASSLKAFLTLSAYATTPWIFLLPLSLFKSSLGLAGAFMGIFGGLLVWFWSVVLFGMAVGITYRLSTEKILIVVLMPFIMTTVFFFWIAGFFSNIIQLFP